MEFKKFKCELCNCNVLQKLDITETNQCLDCSNPNTFVKMTDEQIDKIQPTIPFRRNF